MDAMIGEPGVVGVGYQGLTVDELVSLLEDMQITCVVDVRLTPLSRKPGFSKVRLAGALMSRGISYEHASALGNPKDNRKGFSGDEKQLEEARRRYIRKLNSTEAWVLLDELSERARTERIALLCFEAETERCHRHVLLKEVQDRHLLSHDVPV